MGSNFKMTYAIDIVLVIDATGSMQDLIDTVKENALNFYPDLIKDMERKSKIIHRLRVKIVAFRDYIADKEQAMCKTKFFNLPEEAEDFRDTVNSIEAIGGGDEPEDGLEALAFAIKSEWNNECTKRRQIIVVWSDAPTHQLGYGKSEKSYPINMLPKDFNELTRWWGDVQSQGYVSYNAKRLILFTPDVPGWSNITGSWGNVVHYKSKAGQGLKDIDYNQIIDAISNSI